MIKCTTCKETKQEEEFALTKGKRRETCKKCAKKSNAYYTHPETFFNLFVGKNEWKHVYFEDTIVVGKSF